MDRVHSTVQGSKISMSEGVFKNPFDVIDEDEGDDSISFNTTLQPINELPNEIEQAFKKIVKKGNTTRSKGFAELLSFCRENEISHFSEMLRVPFVKIFTKFAVSSEKSSRLAVAELTGIFTSKLDLKTFLQPILKEILTLWLLSLFDPVAEISALQRRNLEGVFPAGSKLKLLLEKYEKEIVSEVTAFTNPLKFEEIKEICVTEMEGTREEAEGVVELIKTEIVGLINLMHTAFMKTETGGLESVLFLKDKEIGSGRRAALYRLYSKMKTFAWYEKKISALLSKETSPSALPAALDLISTAEDTDICAGSVVIEKESFYLNVLGNAPAAEFKKFGKLLLKFNVEESINWTVKVCNANNLMNKERFLVFWRDIAIGVFNGFGPETKIRALDLLLFRSSKDNINSLISFLPLSSEETMNCIKEAFTNEEIIKACNGKMHPQAIYALSSIQEYTDDSLEELVMTMKLADLQNKELMKVIPEALLTKRLCDANELLSVPETIRLIQSVNPTGAIEILKKREFCEWEKMLKSSLLKRETILNVLFELETFKEYAREHLNENPLVISCAFQTKSVIFDKPINLDIASSVFDELKEFELECPLLKSCLKSSANFSESPRIRNLCKGDKKILYKYLEAEKDAELFERICCEDEEFYPIFYVKERAKLELNGVIEIAMYKSKVHYDDLLLKLLQFPLKKFENQRIACKCAFIHGVNGAKLNFKVKESDFIDCEADELELISISKALESSNKSDFNSVPCRLKDALLLWNHLKSVGNDKAINETLGNMIFSEESCNLFYIAFILIDPVIPVRSDNLSGLIDSLTCKGELACLLLLLSVHLEREDLKKEFWQVQFREKLKGLLERVAGENCLVTELKLRVAAGIWNKLADPEIEILKDCKYEEILSPTSFHCRTSALSFESVGLAELVLMAAPFLEHFELSSLKDLFINATEPSMLMAFRGVYLQLHMDEQLVAASCKLNDTNTANSELSVDEIGGVIFPFYDQLINCKNPQIFVILLEMFVSAAEGSRDDMKLLSLFGDVFKARLLPDLVNIVNVLDIYGTLESFDFTPRDFGTEELVAHLLFRLCSIFPLIICGFGGVPVELCCDAQEILMERELARIRRQPKMTVDAVEIVLKPSITMTTKLVNLRVRFKDEIELSIDLMLPAAFPLQPVRVEGKVKSGLADSKWKSSLLSLQVILRSPSTFSGNLIEAIKRWQANALKLFQGLEECAVCYSVLHASDKSLPGPACKQCKHKFHASCLYKWFKSSGNATCPLCRTLF